MLEERKAGDLQPHTRKVLLEMEVSGIQSRGSLHRREAACLPHVSL